MRFGGGFPFLRLFNHFFRRVARHFLVVAEVLGVDAAPAGQRTQRAGIMVKLLASARCALMT